MNEKVRVICFGVSLTIGGVSQVVINYLTNMDPDKMIFDFATLSDEKIYENVCLERGGQIYTISRIREGVFKNIIGKYKILKSKEYDIVYTHVGYKAVIELLIAKILKIKCRVVHSHIANENENCLRMIMRKICSLFVNLLATHMFACSLEAGLWAYGKKASKSKKFYIINNAIDLRKFTYNQYTRIKMRDEFHIGSQLVFGCIGRFAYQKNYSFLIKIFNEIKKNRNDTLLMLIGDGELMKDIKKKVNEMNLTKYVIFTGARTDVPDLLNAIDVFVLPSLFEGLGMVYIEAQAMGLPCYGSVEGVPQVVGISELMHFISLKDTAEKWAMKILSDNKDLNERKNVHHQIRIAGYDIVIEANKLESILLSSARIE